MPAYVIHCVFGINFSSVNTWSLPFSQITATCTNPCLNGGTCTAPDTCTCDVGWIGAQCETGTVHGLTHGHKVRCEVNITLPKLR